MNLNLETIYKQARNIFIVSFLSLFLIGLIGGERVPSVIKAFIMALCIASGGFWRYGHFYFKREKREFILLFMVLCIAIFFAAFYGFYKEFS